MATASKTWFIRRRVSWLLIIAAVFLALAGGTAWSHEPATVDKGKVFDEVWTVIEKDFFDPTFNGVNWKEVGSVFREKALAAQTEEQFAGVVNTMLGTLKVSHTAYFSTVDPKRYQIAGVFGEVLGKDLDALCNYEGIGIDTTEIEGKTFVRAVFDGHPAATAGILFGDELIIVDGKKYRSIESFRGKAGQNVVVQVRRRPDADPLSINVPVEWLDGRTMFEQALDASVRTFDDAGRRIGYVHVWSYAGSKYHDLLKDHILFGALNECDALIVDLRDGWGGASLDYVNLFREPIAEIESKQRNGTVSNFTGVWGKPVCLLVNNRSTSGKELFTYGFKKLGLGPVVGERTAGAVLAGSVRRLSNDAILYLAVSNLWIDGQRFEGIGIEPTISVERPIPYAAGSDPQLDRALDVLQKQSALPK